MRKYRVGIVGLGRIAVELPDNHMKAYTECDRTEIVAVCDIKWSYNFHKYTFFHEHIGLVKFWAESLDIVSVCTPPETHCKIVCDIAPYVKAIYCEKPIAENLNDAQLMIDTCHKYGVILQINHQRLFMNPVFKFSRGWLNTGTHAISLANHLFAYNIKVEYQYIDTDDYIFELDCTHNDKPMIPKGVEELVNCLDEGRESVSSGEKAMEALREALEHT